MSKIYEVHTDIPHKIRRIFITDVESDGTIPPHSVATIVASSEGELRAAHVTGTNPDDLMSKLESWLNRGGLSGFSLVEVVDDGLSDLYPLTD